MPVRKPSLHVFEFRSSVVESVFLHKTLLLGCGATAEFLSFLRVCRVVKARVIKIDEFITQREAGREMDLISVHESRDEHTRCLGGSTRSKRGTNSHALRRHKSLIARKVSLFFSFFSNLCAERI